MTPSRFTTARVAMGMNQGQLASALGITVRQVNRYENGQSAIPYPVVIALDHLAHCSRPPPKPEQDHANG